MAGYFITGTDTGVGKTTFLCAWLDLLKKQGHTRAIGWKPLCCGPRHDAELILEHSCAGPSLNEVNPVWFQFPGAPLVASMVENRPINESFLRDSWQHLSQTYDPILVEGAGGWLTPLNLGRSMADLAVDLGLPVVLVVLNRLGALNHALLSKQAIEKSGLPFHGWVLNDGQIKSPSPGMGQDDQAPAQQTNPAILEELLGSSPLAVLPALSNDQPINWAPR